MSRRTLVALIALATPLMLLGGLSRLQPAAAAVTTAASQCAPLDANTANCSLTLDGSLVAGETVTVAASSGSLDQVSYAGGCQPAAAITPPALASSASFTFTAPDGGCAGPVTFSETVSGLGGSGALVQIVTDSGAPGTVLNTSVFLVGFAGGASCAATGTAGSFTCQLSVNASANMADTTLSVALSDGIFTGVSFVSGCLNPPSLSVSSTSFSLVTPAGGCGGFGPLVFNEMVAGVSAASLTQAVSASGASSGTGSIVTQLPLQAGGTVTLTGTKLCGRGDNAGDDDNGDDLAYSDDNQAAGVRCTLTLQPSAPLAASTMLTVQIGGNAAFASVSYDGGCAAAPFVSVGGASFSFAVPDGGCAGPLVFAETLSVTGAGGGPLAQTAAASGASSGAITILATRRDGSAFTLPSTQNGNGGNGGDNDNGNGNGRGNGGGNGGAGNGNGDNHSVPACQNSRGRARQQNPHCQGGDD